jgi:hypothetical protein
MQKYTLQSKGTGASNVDRPTPGYPTKLAGKISWRCMVV